MNELLFQALITIGVPHPIALAAAESVGSGGGGGGSVVINDTLTSTATDQALSAARGKALQDTKAPIASPTFTGTPSGPTAAAGTNTTQFATTAFVKVAVDNLLSGAPGALDTLNELAAALGNDANFAASVTAALAAKQATLVSGTNIKTVAGQSLLGSGDLSLPTTVVAINASRNITAADDGKILDMVDSGLMLTVPEGLNPTPTIIVQPHSGGTLIAFSGAATGNGAATTITRTQSASLRAFSILPTSVANAYEITGG